jgi:hypothetical protein
MSRLPDYVLYAGFLNRKACFSFIALSDYAWNDSFRASLEGGGSRPVQAQKICREILPAEAGETERVSKAMEHDRET